MTHSFRVQFFITFWLLVLAGTSAFAQQKRFIRAGEQQNYTRLVFPSAANQNWEMRTSNRRVTLSISQTDMEYDDEKIFDRIARGRILETSVERIGTDVYVRLSLGCDCVASAKVESIDLIIDISQKKQETAVQESKKQQNDVEASNTTIAQNESRPTLRPKTDATEKPETAIAETDANKAASSDLPADVFDVSERLKKQLEKAANQGLIELAPSNEPVIPPETASSSETKTEPVHTDPKLNPNFENIDGLDDLAKRAGRSLSETLGLDESLSDSIRITIPEGFDQTEPNRPKGKAKSDSELAENLEQSFCFEDEYLDIREWSDGREFSEQFSELQNAAFGEFDEPVITAVHDLIRLYLYFGLGTEAKSLVQDLAKDDPQSQLFLELARIVDGEEHIPNGSLDSLAGCTGLNSLWRTAAIDTSEKQPVSKPNALIEEFAEFPIEIRRLVGPRIVQSFLTRNQLEEATKVYSIIERAPGTHGDEHRFVGAKLDIEKGHTEQGENKLWSLINEGSHKSVEAAVALANSLMDRGVKVPKELTDLLNTLAFEYRETTLGLDLRLAEIFSRSGSNQLDDAVSIIKREMALRPEFQQDYYRALNDILSNATAKDSGSGILMQTFFDNRELFTTERISTSTKQHMAEEFLKSGLPEAAVEILNSTNNETDETSKLIEARARLELDEPSAAIELVSGLELESSHSTMIKALAKLGRHRETYETAASKNTEEVPMYAWNAGAWEDAVNSSESNIATLAQYMLTASEDSENMKRANVQLDVSNPGTAILSQIPEEENITLEYAQQLSEQSKLVRQFFESALSDFD